ncbi:hypothetical protein [Priestia megaterium]|uniref:hypothetical protein n=1 Tax=Priestia megaterium TaxID=1404 RepID=UPI002877869C|nr:hypothetical protein [Priestia megaterium]
MSYLVSWVTEELKDGAYTEINHYEEFDKLDDAKSDFDSKKYNMDYAPVKLLAVLEEW